MTTCVDPINSPQAWRDYVDDIEKGYEKVLFHESQNIEKGRDPIHYLTTLENLLDRPNAEKFIGLTVSWQPQENPSPAQMRATLDHMLERASEFCCLSDKTPVDLRDLPLLRGAHLNTGHPHVHNALCLIHPAYLAPVLLNGGWEVRLFQHVARRAELDLAWATEPNAPRYRVEEGRLVLAEGQEEGFRLTPAERRMEWINGECAKRRLRRFLRHEEPTIFQNWDKFGEFLRWLEASYYEYHRRWVFELNGEIVAAREVGAQWGIESLVAAWGHCPVSRQLGMGSVEQTRLRAERRRVDNRLSPNILRSIDQLKPDHVKRELRAFGQSLKADYYRVIIEDFERRRERCDNAPGFSFLPPEQAERLRTETLSGKTVYIIPEKQGCVPLPLSGLSWSSKEALVAQGYTPAAVFDTSDGKYTALFWARSLGEPSKDYNAGRHWLRLLEKAFAASGVSFPQAPIPCPGLHQAAQSGHKCSAVAVTGKVCQKASLELLNALAQFDREEARWHEGKLRIAAERLNTLVEVPPELRIYRAHVHDLLQTSKIRCHHFTDLDLRVAVRLLAAGQSPELVKSVVEKTAVVLRGPGPDGFWQDYDWQSYTSRVVSLAEDYREHFHADAKSWQAVNQVAVDLDTLLHLEKEARKKQKKWVEDRDRNNSDPQVEQRPLEPPVVERSRGVSLERSQGDTGTDLGLSR